MRLKILKDIAGAIWTRENARLAALRAPNAEALVRAAVVFDTASRTLDADIVRLAATFVPVGGKP